MRYRIRRLEIRTENAAKPVAQQSHYLVQLLRSLRPLKNAMDFGCGKLRYARELLKRAESVTFVDSKTQLDREQMILGHFTSVRRYVETYWPRANVVTIDECAHLRAKFDFILCANVLSAIPCRETRTQALSRIRQALAPMGYSLFVTQYKNTEFLRPARSRKSVAHLDGWIIQSLRGAAYYGIIDKPKLLALLQKHKFKIVRLWTKGESVFALARR